MLVNGLGYDTVSYRTFQELAKNPESGINIRDAIDYFDFNPTGHEGRDPWWSKIVDDVRTKTYISTQDRAIDTLPRTGSSRMGTDVSSPY